MPLTLKQIRYFVSTAERGQVSQAAVELFISQSAITTAIKELEHVVGVSLFTRSRQGMKLTAAGRQFLQHAYDILDKVGESTRLDVLTNNLEGSLSVVATYTVIGYFLPAHLNRIKRAFPRVEIQIFEHVRETIEEGLLSNRYDIALLLTTNTVNASIATETLLRSTRRLWVSSRHRLLERPAVSLYDISHEPYVMLTVDEAARTAMRYWNLSGYQPSVTLRTSSVEAVRSHVANGNNVAILSDMVYRPWSLEGRRIETIVPTDPIPTMDVGLAWKKGVTFTPEMEAFRSYFRSTYHVPGN